MKRVGDRQFELLVTFQAAGAYQYKFIVDNQWLCAEDQPKVRDNSGNWNNKVDVVVPQLPQIVAPAESAKHQDVVMTETQPEPLPAHQRAEIQQRIQAEPLNETGSQYG